MKTKCKEVGLFMCEVPQGHLDHTELINFGSNSSWLLESFKTASAMEKTKRQVEASRTYTWEKDKAKRLFFI